MDICLSISIIQLKFKNLHLFEKLSTLNLYTSIALNPWMKIYNYIKKSFPWIILYTLVTLLQVLSLII